MAVSTEDIVVPSSPTLLGLPHENWWPGQKEAVSGLLEDDKTVSLVTAPTGSGKSLMGLAWALGMNAERTIVLCRSKLLQKQYLDVFGGAMDGNKPMLDYLTGKNNWTCVHPSVPMGTTVDEAPCSAGFACPLRHGGCQYYDHINKAADARVVIANYPVWLLAANAENKFQSPLSAFYMPDALVCDEGHALVFGDEIDILSSIELWPQTFERFDLGPLLYYSKTTYYNALAEKKLDPLKLHYEARLGELSDAINGGYISKDQVRELGELRMLIFAFERLSSITDPKGWIVDGPKKDNQPLPDGTPVDKWRVKICPILGGDRRKLVYKHAKKILIMSATLLPTPETAQFLGLEKGEYNQIELPSSFPIENRPIFYSPAGKVTKDSFEKVMPRMVKRLDEIISNHLPERGIVHATSFMMVKATMEMSKYKSQMVTHENKNRLQIIKRWLEGKGPPILISPSVHEGLDAKDDIARWQVIMKVPYPNLGEPLWRARLNLGNNLYHYAAASGVVQMAGRVVRSAEDQGVTYILDAKFEDLRGQYPTFFPKWFKEALTDL